MGRRCLFLVLFCSQFSVAKELSGWVGEWTGWCQSDNFNSESSLPSLHMSLEIGEIDSENYSWKIQYEGEGVRDYKMTLQKDLEGHWLLDEGNGLLIDRFLSDGTLVDQFLINGKLFLNRTTLIKDKMKIETISFWANQPRQTSLADGSNPIYSFSLRDQVVCELNRESQEPF